MRAAEREFEGRTVLVVAAGGGIGSAVAERFGAAGATVVAAARLIDDRLTDLVDRIEARGGSAVPTAVDVTDEDSVHAAVRTAAQVTGRLDVMVNLAEYGIRVNTVSPGVTATSMSLRPGETDADRADRVAGAIPLGRVADPDEIASAVLWLAGDQASYVTGHDLVVDGGHVLP